MSDSPATLRRPALITLGIWLCWITAALAIVLLLVAWFEVVPIPQGARTVSGHQYLRDSGWVLGADAALAIAVAVGAMRRARWTRPLVLAQWLLVPLASAVGGGDGVGMAAVATVLGIAFSWWYLYRKPNVRAFFELPASR